MIEPVRVIVGQCTDRPWPVSSSQLMGKVRQWVQWNQAWFRSEDRVTFDYTTHWISTERPHEWIALEERRDGVTKDWRGGDGRGLDSGKVMTVIQEADAQPIIPNKTDGPWRFLVLWAHGGGWAGGFGPDQKDRGWMLLGDINILAVLQRTALQRLFPTAEQRGDGEAWMHETGHAFGISEHIGDLLPDGSTVTQYLQPKQDGRLSVGQKQQLISKNMRFLRAV